MEKIIVTTTIYPPSIAIRKFAAIDNWEVIVVGDLKTPHEKYKNMHNIIYLSPEEQKKKYSRLSNLIGWNCVQRRNIGFIEAYKHGADIIATVDDDNIPYDNWGKNILIGKEIEVNFYNAKSICFDPVGAANHKNLWHRGFPLQLLKKRENDYSNLVKKTIKPDIQADFWNGDPDIDAICRIRHEPKCNFDGKFFPMATNVFSPFNSQNTFISRNALKHYFMFPHVGRMDDIWASYYLEALGHMVVYGPPTVYQERNVQDYTENLVDEFLGYKNNLRLLKALSGDPKNIKLFLPKKSWEAFVEYQKCLRGNE